MVLNPWNRIAGLNGNDSKANRWGGLSPLPGPRPMPILPRQATACSDFQLYGTPSMSTCPPIGGAAIGVPSSSSTLASHNHPLGKAARPAVLSVADPPADYLNPRTSRPPTKIPLGYQPQQTTPSLTLNLPLPQTASSPAVAGVASTAASQVMLKGCQSNPGGQVTTIVVDTADQQQQPYCGQVVIERPAPNKIALGSQPAYPTQPLKALYQNSHCKFEQINSSHPVQQ